MSNFIPKIVYNSTTIELDFPPEKDPRGQEFRQIGKTSISKGGVQQTVTDFIEEVLTVNFSFLTETKKVELQTFLLTWALFGKEFQYFEDKDTPGTARTVKLDRQSFKAKFKIITRKGSGFLYKVTLKFRQVV